MKCLESVNVNDQCSINSVYLGISVVDRQLSEKRYNHVLE